MMDIPAKHVAMAQPLLLVHSVLTVANARKILTELAHPAAQRVTTSSPGVPALLDQPMHPLAYAPPTSTRMESPANHAPLAQLAVQDQPVFPLADAPPTRTMMEAPADHAPLAKPPLPDTTH